MNWRNTACRYSPWIVFHTQTGQRAYFLSNVRNPRSRFVDGQDVPVLYDPLSSAPGETAYIRDYGMRVSTFVWLMAVGFGAAALLVRILPERARLRASETTLDSPERRRRSR